MRFQLQTAAACLVLVLSSSLTHGQESNNEDAKPDGLGSLPWAVGREEIRPSTSRLPSPRKTLEVFEIGESELKRFVDGETFQSDDEEPLLRIINAIRRFRPEDIARWVRPTTDWSELVEDPDSSRTQFYGIEGRVREFEERKLAPEISRLFNYDHYYIVTFELDDEATDIRICCLSIPEAWRKAEELNERSYAAGMFLKVGEKSNDRQELIFATPHIAWRPDAKTEIETVTGSELMLADLGVDIGSFVKVKERNGKRMGAEERDPFYEILTALPNAPVDRMKRLNRAFSLTDAIQSPQRMQGGIYTVRGRARRITRVLIGEKEQDIRERFDIDHYYMIDFFIPLGDLTLQLRGAQGKASSPIYQDGFPAVVCVKSLPPELEAVNDRLAKARSGEELLNEEIELTGVFFRLWSYRSEYVAEFDPSQKQISPMFLAVAPRLVRPDSDGHRYLGVGVAGFFIVALAGIWLVVWRAGKSDAAFEKETLRRRLEPQTDKSLNDLGIEAQDEPDFSGLD